MRKFIPLILILGALTALGVVLWHLAGGGTPGVLSPVGPVAGHERSLIIFGTILSVVIVVPVFALTFGIVWKYRAGSTTSHYTPDWDGSAVLESIWWGIPCLIILILAVVTWRSSHELDPAAPLASQASPLTVQVVALDWKWLFIYPSQGIATVNYLQVPVGTPVNFVITSDAPMNSFWIPRLGGQIYAMPGMSTQLHLQADTVGDYAGSSANISGRGFSGMRFVAHATSRDDFDTWVTSSQASTNELTMASYTRLARPSENVAPATYVAPDHNLYNEVVMKYMMPNMALSPSGATP